MSKGKEMPIDVYVKLPSGRTSSFQLSQSDLVQTVFERIAREEHVPVDLVQIKYTGKCLNPTLTVGYTGICAETILKAEIVTVREFGICVKLPEGGKTLSTTVRNVSTIGELKGYINRIEGIPRNQQILKLAGRVLDNDDQKAMDAGLTDETVLELELKPAAEAAGKGKSASGSATTATSVDELCDADKRAVVGTFQAAGRPVDVVFSFDTTGSMYSCLAKVRSKLSSIVRSLVQQVPDVRIGLIAHGDYCDYGSYVARTVDLTSDVDRLVNFVADVPATSGGDTPECYEWVLHAAQSLDWAEQSAKALVVIGDAPPHAVSYTDQRTNWHHELDTLSALGVKVYGVHALNCIDVEPFYRQLAEVTGGAYVKFNNFDVIADMFLAVCYREASDEQYRQFCDDVATRSDMCEQTRADVSDVIRQLDEQATRPPTTNHPKRYVASDWWDPALDRGSAQYSYDAQTDKWSPVGSRQQNTDTALKPDSIFVKDSTHRTSRRMERRRTFGSKRTQRCLVM